MRRTLLIFLALLSVPGVVCSQGNPLGPEFRVNTYTTDLQWLPSVAADGSGNFVVVWWSNNQDGSSAGVFGQRYASSGMPLGSEFRVNTYTTGGQIQPRVGSDTVGNFVVVWSSLQDGASYGISGQRYASSGAPLGPEFRVNTFTTNSQEIPAVTSDASGNFVVVWDSYSQDGSLRGVYGQRYASSGAPLGPEFRVNTYTTSGQERASIAAEGSGNFVVVWQSYGQDGSSEGVFGQRYASSGTLLGPEFRVNTYTTSFQGSPSVAADTAGNFVVVWESYGQDGSNRGVFGQRYASSGAPVGPEFRVNTYTTGIQDDPSVATDASGNFVVVYKSGPDGSTFEVFAQRYASSGAPLGPEFLVNTYTEYNQELPSVASDPSGNFVIVWSSDMQDYSSSGVFGQRYGRIVPVDLMHFGVE